MTAALLLFLAAIIVPVFFAKVHSTALWVGAQGAALAWVIAQHGQWSAHALLEAGEVLIVRAAVTPWLVRRAILRRAEASQDLMPSNLFAWAIGIALVVFSFEFAAPAGLDGHTLILGVVGATVAVSLLVLSTNASAVGQLAAVLFMENALALFESLLGSPWPVAVHVALSLVYVVTVAVGAWLIGAPEQVPIMDPGATGERP